MDFDLNTVINSNYIQIEKMVKKIQKNYTVKTDSSDAYIGSSCLRLVSVLDYNSYLSH